MAVCGIYKITNKITQKSYIGQSVDIFRRLGEHQNTVSNKIDWHNELHNHPNNFTFEVLETCEAELLNEKEIYYIEKYNSFYDGLNKTPGNIHAAENKKEPSIKLVLSEKAERANDEESSFKTKVYRALNTTTFKKAIKKAFGKDIQTYYLLEPTREGEEGKFNGAFLIPYAEESHLCPPIYLPFIQGEPWNFYLSDKLRYTLARIVVEETGYAKLPFFIIHRTANRYDCKWCWRVNVFELEKIDLKRIKFDKF